MIIKMIIYKNDKDYVEGLRLIPDKGKNFLNQFRKNPDCHFWIAREGEDICALLIGELKYGKLEIFRLYGKSRIIPDYIISSIIGFLIKNKNIFGIAVYQNLKSYFPILEKFGFVHDADILMELDVSAFRDDLSGLPSLELESLNSRHFCILLSLRKLCYTNDFYQRLIAESCLDAYCRDTLKLLCGPKNFGLVGKHGNQYIGAITWQEDELPEILDIMVSPEKQGCGYGSALLQRAIILLSKKGFSKIKLGVFESNIQAKRLYQKIGFIEKERLALMYFLLERMYMVPSYR